MLMGNSVDLVKVRMQTAVHEAGSVKPNMLRTFVTVARGEGVYHLPN